MKKITILFITLLLTSSLNANDAQKSTLATDMVMMLESLVNIQRAGFYNNKEVVNNEALKLIKSLDSLIDKDASTYLSDNKIDAEKFAKKRAKMIKMYAEDLILSVKAGNIEDSLQDYTQILFQCASCHSRIREKSWCNE